MCLEMEGDRRLKSEGLRNGWPSDASQFLLVFKSRHSLWGRSHAAITVAVREGKTPVRHFWKRNTNCKTTCPIDFCEIYSRPISSSIAGPTGFRQGHNSQTQANCGGGFSPASRSCKAACGSLSSSFLLR